MGTRPFFPFVETSIPRPPRAPPPMQSSRLIFRPTPLQLFLLRYRAHVELVPTERTAVLTATFEEERNRRNRSAFSSISRPSGHDRTRSRDALSIRFTSTANSGGVPENFATYYLLQLQTPWDSFEVKEAGAHRIGILRFRQGLHIEAHIATSFISFEQAALNLRNEIGQRSVEQLRSCRRSQMERSSQPNRDRRRDRGTAPHLLFVSVPHAPVSANLARAGCRRQDASLQRLQRQGDAGCDVCGPRLLGRVSRLVST